MSNDKTSEPRKRTAQQWLSDVEGAYKREKAYRTDGKEVLSIYEGEKVETTPFNILYSNTETLSPALYNTLPRPVAERRYKDEDVVAKLSAELAQRSLEYMIDDSNPDDGSFDNAIRVAVTEALLPGRGVTRFKFDAKIEEPPKDAADDVVPEVKDPKICWEEIPWNRFSHGYAKKWRNVPWICIEHSMDKQELIDNFGEEKAKLVSLTPPTVGEGEESETSGQQIPGVSDRAQVFEIWDKRSRQVLFVSPGYKDDFLKVTGDTQKLRGFFPIPRPLMFFQKVNDLVPRALYTLYKSQAEELNKTTIRIKKLIEACKIRGFYDATVDEIAKVIEAEDNVLLPITNAAQLQSQGQTLDKAIWLFPVEKIPAVLLQLYNQREAAKRTLYEINGIADIMRGASQASETLGAQEIKNQWGGLRLKRMQKEVSRYVRDCLRLMAELTFEHLPPEVIKAMTNSELPMAAEKAQAVQLLQAAQQSGQQPDPQAVAIAQMPSLEEAIELMKNDMGRSYRIDIETNSTVDAEATEDKAMVGEVLNAMAQFLNGVAPLIEKGILPYEAAKGMLQAIVRRFRFGKELEDEIAKMTAPQQAPGAEGETPAGEPAPNPAVVEAETEAAKTKMIAEQQKQRTIEMQAELDAAEHQMRMTEIAAKTEALQRKSQLDGALHVQRMQQAATPPKPPAKTAAK